MDRWDTGSSGKNSAHIRRGVGRGSHSGHPPEQAKIVDVACPGRECLHREDMLGQGCIGPLDNQPASLSVGSGFSDLPLHTPTTNLP